MPSIERLDTVFVLRFAEPEDPADAPDNVFSPDFLDSLDECLDEIERSEGPAALVTTGAGKFYSNGLDLAHVSADPSGLPAYITRVHGLFARMIRLETPTVAAVNGHAFGAGAMLAICHDRRIMREDRGFWNLPEAALGMPFPPGMRSLVATQLGHAEAGTAMLTSHRYAAEEAVAKGIAHETSAEAGLVERAVTVATELAPMRGANYRGIRTGLLAEVLRNLDEPVTAV